MILKDDDFQLTLPGENYPEYSQRFAYILLRTLKKGIKNPAFQLHLLSLMTTGRTFIDLAGVNATDIEQLTLTAKILAQGVMEIDFAPYKPNMSEIGIDHFLKGKDEA